MGYWVLAILIAFVLILIIVQPLSTSHEGFVGSPAEIYKASKPLYDKTEGAAAFSEFKTVVDPALSGGGHVDADIHKRTLDKYNENPRAYSEDAVAAALR